MHMNIEHIDSFREREREGSERYKLITTMNWHTFFFTDVEREWMKSEKKNSSQRFKIDNLNNRLAKQCNKIDRTMCAQIFLCVLLSPLLVHCYFLYYQKFHAHFLSSFSFNSFYYLFSINKLIEQKKKTIAIRIESNRMEQYQHFYVGLTSMSFQKRM